MIGIPRCASGCFLIQPLRLKCDVLLAGRSLFPVLAHPGFPALAGRGVTAAKGQGGDLRVRNRNFLRGILGVEPDDGFCKSLAGTAIEDVPFDLAPVFAGNGYISAIIKGFLQSLAQLFLASHCGNPAFQFFMGETRDYLERVRILAGWSRLMRSFLLVSGTAHARVSSRWPEFSWICTSG